MSTDDRRLSAPLDEVITRHLWNYWGCRGGYADGVVAQELVVFWCVEAQIGELLSRAESAADAAASRMMDYAKKKGVDTESCALEITGFDRMANHMIGVGRLVRRLVA